MILVARLAVESAVVAVLTAERTPPRRTDRARTLSKPGAGETRAGMLPRPLASRIRVAFSYPLFFLRSS